MNATCSTTQATSPGGNCVPTGEIDASCRAPLLVLFGNAAFWLLVASVFGLVASLKFHAPNLLSGCSWFTYGRVHAVATTAFLYGFAIEAGLGVGLWILARSGQTQVAQPWFIAIGGRIWNLGVLLGVIGILAGNSTGFDNLEMPHYSAVPLFIGYLLIGLWSVLTLHQRRERSLQPSGWFLIAALFWFPWIFSTAQLMLVWCPVRGVTQAVIAWWFSTNLNSVWLALVGLAAIFHFIPKLMNKPLHSQYLALFTFWTLILFSSWGGIPASAPLPAWMPALSAVATLLTGITVLSVVVNVYKTAGRGCSQQENPPAGKFIAFGVMAFVVSGLMNVAGAIPQISTVTNFTWFTVAQSQLNSYGFFAMTMFGAIYYIVPLVTGIEWPSTKSVKAHFWLAAIGIILVVVPLAIGGVVQGIKLNHPQIAFVDLTKATLPFLRASTTGDLLIAFGHLLFAMNFARLMFCLARTHLAPAYAAATVELKPAEVKP